MLVLGMYSTAVAAAASYYSLAGVKLNIHWILVDELLGGDEF